MSSLQTFALSWSEFVIHYKLIKHLTQFSAHPFYGKYSLYLHLPSKIRILAKEIHFANQDQFTYVLKEINEATSFNQCQSLCKFIKYCVKLHPQISKTINQKQCLQKSGQILLLYENEKSLDEIVKLMIASSSSISNPSFHSVSGFSPTKMVTFAQSTGFHECFSEKSLSNILGVSLKFIYFLRREEIDFIKGISMQMVQVYHLGEIDEKCMYFLYPFVENELLEMIRQNRIEIQDVFVGQNVLKMINMEEGRSATRRRVELNKNNNNFSEINLSASPTFGAHQIFRHSQELKGIEEDVENVYTQLLQSVGLLMVKLMLFSISKEKYLQTKLYQMNQHYQLAINFDAIRSSISQLRNLNLYSKTFISHVELLLFHPSQINTSELTSLQLSNSNKRHQKSVSISKSNHNKSLDKSSLQNSNKSPIQLTPSKKNSISTSKPQNKSRKELNQTLKQQKIFINPYPFDKSLSKPKHKSASFHLQKPQNTSMPHPKQFSPTLITKETSSNKKPTSIQKPLSSNTKTVPQNNLSQTIVQKLKAKILYDQNGKLYPNMIQKKFRDGSTYYGQYNPKLNIKEGNGLYFYFQGDVYGGTWKNDQLNGLGIYYFANGDSYEGEVINGEKNGFGVYHYANGNVYKGFWKHDKKDGQGNMTYANGDSYEGNFIDGRKQGNGIYLWANGDIYEGSFLKNVKHGWGVFHPVHSSNFLQCLWQNDKIDDKQTAKIIYKDSNKIYEGQIKSNGTIDGQGKLTFDKNGFYQGSIKNNNYEGECVIYFPNGDMYKGQVTNNLFEGYGEYFFEAKKLSYAGNWHQGLKHGEGRIIDGEGTEIFSNWQKGMMSQKGVIKYVNKNERYEGEINQNGRHGEGKYFFEKGQWIWGIFQNNTLVQIYSTS